MRDNAEQARKEIAAKTEAFLAEGGKVTKVGQGVSGLDFKNPSRHISYSKNDKHLRQWNQRPSGDRKP